MREDSVRFGVYSEASYSNCGSCIGCVSIPWRLLEMQTTKRCDRPPQSESALGQTSRWFLCTQQFRTGGPSEVASLKGFERAEPPGSMTKFTKKDSWFNSELLRASISSQPLVETSALVKFMMGTHWILVGECIFPLPLFSQYCANGCGCIIVRETANEFGEYANDF